MTHLTPEQFVDAVEGTLTAAGQWHLRDCATCAGQVSQMRAMLGEVAGVETPEPSPIFWDRFSARVHEAIAEETRPARRARWFEWPVLVPLGAMALLLVALGAGIARQPVAPLENSTAGSEAVTLPISDDLAALGESEWVLVAQIVGPVDLENAGEAGIIVKPGDVEQAALRLTTEQQHELVRLVQAEIDKAGS
jgi:hypothetical protein